MMIEINSGWIEELIKCKKINKKFDRDFSKWTIEQLLAEAIMEFKNKYDGVGLEAKK
jgi:hypothetical protein